MFTLTFDNANDSMYLRNIRKGERKYEKKQSKN